MLVFCCAGAAAVPAAAATAESSLVWIVESETVPEDLYAVGNEIRIDGRIEGDLLALAGGRLQVDGVVTGSITALASTVTIGGEVGGSVIVAASDVIIAGQVGGDVVTAALDLAVEGQVGRDLLAAVWSAHTNGVIERDLKGVFRSLDLGGQVSENVEVRVNRLDVGDGLSVLGHLDYQADRVVGIEQMRAGVEGSLVDRTALPPNIRIRGLRLMTVVLMSLLIVVTGLLVVRWRRPWVESASLRVVTKPWRSSAKGLALLFSPLVGLTILVLVVLWLPVYIWGPLLVVGIPFLTIAAGFWLLAVLAAHIPVALAVGRALGNLFGRHWESHWAYLVGAALYLAVLRIPILGLPLVAIATFVGAGAWGKRNHSNADAAELVQTESP